jgi:rSAM/selenodomain-associated transferase 2
VRAERAGAKVVATPRGRGPQMNAGAANTTGDVVLFLHADTRLPEDAFEHVRETLANEDVAGGAFHLSIEDPSWYFAFTSRNANIRSKLLGAPYGDQAFFVRRAAFEALGGFRDYAFAEDLDFIRRLRTQGRVRLAPAAVVTSARRWEKHGRLRTTLRNSVLFVRYWLGRLEERPKAPPAG